MKKIFILFILILSALSALRISAFQLKETLISENNNILTYNYVLTGGGRNFYGRAVLVRSTNTDADRLVVVIPGYSPKGDPYYQEPEQFVRRWNLAHLPQNNRMNFLVIGMGASMYPLAQSLKTNQASDLRFLAAVISSNRERTGGLPVWLVGISTGVEGAVKLRAMAPKLGLQGIKGIIGISGTWDFSRLDPKSGEYGLHKALFGSDKKIWAAENPLNLIKKIDDEDLSIHIFSEKKSIFFDQMMEVKNLPRNKTRIEIHPGFGYGFQHNWDFWASPELVRYVFHVIEMNE
jgi:hypothetical protein